MIRGNGKQITPKVRQWIAELQGYDITYVPIEGKKNTRADILSRLAARPSVLEVEDIWSHMRWSTVSVGQYTQMDS